MRKAKFQQGNSFGRLDIKGLQSDPQWKKYQYKLHPKNLEVLQDSMYVRRMPEPQRVAMLSQVISENGGYTTPHGNGAYGLVGWRGDRAYGLSTNISDQVHRLMEDTYNNGNYREWTHGGKGTGVKTGKEMQQLYRSTPNYIQATNAFMKGYVRPPQSVLQKRVNLASLIRKHMK